MIVYGDQSLVTSVRGEASPAAEVSHMSYQPVRLESAIGKISV